ncbi:MAG: transcriptional regulator [Actinomycetota bacterium]|nr:transcriptional regulator [Actinomycetota bacterium]
MRQKREGPPVLERPDTIRHEIMAALKSQKTLTAKDISQQVRISEKEVYGHLEHIQKSLGGMHGLLIITPAQCKKCGFIFKKRERLTKPGRCPVCRNEAIRPPGFSIGSN